MDIRQLADRNHGTILCRNQYLAYLILATAESRFVADHDIELTLVLIKQGALLPPIAISIMDCTSSLATP